jgi:hypothetical protein
MRWSLLSLLVLGIAAAGCVMEYPLNIKQKWDMKPLEMRVYEHSGMHNQKKITVTVTSKPSDADIAVALVLKEDLEAAKKAMREGGDPPKYLPPSTIEGKTEFKPIIAAGQGFGVIVRNKSSDDPVSVELTITSK